MGLLTNRYNKDILFMLSITLYQVQVNCSFSAWVRPVSMLFNLMLHVPLFSTCRKQYSLLFFTENNRGIFCTCCSTCFFGSFVFRVFLLKLFEYSFRIIHTKLHFNLSYYPNQNFLKKILTHIWALYQIHIK